MITIAAQPDLSLCLTTPLACERSAYVPGASLRGQLDKEHRLPLLDGLETRPRELAAELER